MHNDSLSIRIAFAFCFSRFCSRLRLTMIVFNHLRTFLAVARFGSFTRAARQLCITQPAVSGHIAALEEELGAQLFNRTGREIVLTDSGRVVQKAARDIMDRLDLMQSELADVSTLKGGTIRIGASRIVGVYLLPKIVTAFREAFPDIEIQLSIHSAHTIAESVLENAFDIAVVAEGDQFFSSNVGVKAIGSDPLVVIASNDYVRRRFGRNVLTIEQASREQFILPESSTASAQNLRRELGKLGLHLKSTIEIGEAGAIKRAVEADAGLAIISRFVVERELAEGRLAELTIEGWRPNRQILMLWRHDRRFSKSTEAFMQFLMSRLKENAAQ